MKTIHINLNQLQDFSTVKRQTIQLLFAYIIVTIAIILISAVVYLQYSQLQRKVAILQNTSKRYATQINLLQQSVDYISEQEVRELKHLNSSRLFWTKKLESLANITGKNIALTSVKYDTNKLFISGIAKIQKEKTHFTVISEFIEQIKLSPHFYQDFNSFDFISSKRANFGRRNYIQFEVLGHAKP